MLTAVTWLGGMYLALPPVSLRNVKKTDIHCITNKIIFRLQMTCLVLFYVDPRVTMWPVLPIVSSA